MSVQRDRAFEIEGVELGYPTIFRDGASAAALFVVDSSEAQRLIDDTGFQIAEIAPGRGVLAFTCVHYTDTDCRTWTTGAAPTPTPTITRVGRWPATRPSSISSSPSTAAGSTTPWWSTGRTALGPGGEIRDQYHYITDVAPTILEATRIERPDSYHGIPQQPFTGVALSCSFDAPDAPNAKERQYYEMFGNRAIWVDVWKAVTLHANRMPWELNEVQPLEDDVWELYHVAEDFSESQDLAASHPEKLAELIEIFAGEAWANNVYPLYDDMIMRISKQQDRLFGDRKDFVYFAPGAVRIAEKASAPVKDRSHEIVTKIDLQGGEEGVIVACGGMTGGYTLYIKGGRARFDYNHLDGVHYHTKSPKLPKGPTEIRFNFIRSADFAGTRELYIDGKKVDEADMPKMHISTYSLAETFDVGMDTGTQVDPAYAGSPFPFTGEIDRVVFTMKD